MAGFDAQDGLPVAIWFTPRDKEAGVEASLAVEVVGGQKRYLRLWLDQGAPTADWGWVVHASAVKLWSDDEG